MTAAVNRPVLKSVDERVDATIGLTRNRRKVVERTREVDTVDDKESKEILVSALPRTALSARNKQRMIARY